MLHRRRHPVSKRRIALEQVGQRYDRDKGNDGADANGVENRHHYIGDTGGPQQTLAFGAAGTNDSKNVVWDA